MRKLIIVAAALAAAGGCGLAPSAGNEARSEAREAARRAANAVTSHQDRSAQDMGHLLADRDGVEVMAVGGGRTLRGGGVWVVVRTVGTGSDPTDPWDEEVEIPSCFRLRLDASREWDQDPEHVACPKGAPLTFKPWPKTPEVPSERRLKAALGVPEGGTVAEAGTRAALASLRLDPAIRVETRTGEVKGERAVGVVLSVRPYLSKAFDCTLVRIRPGRTEVWVPPRIQRMPGEGGCSAANALNPLPPGH